MGLCFTIDEQKSSQHKHGRSPKKSPEMQGSNEIKTRTVIPLTVAKDVKDLRQNPGYNNVCIITYEETRLAKKEFRPDNIVGEGGFRVVYKGVIEENVRPGYPSTAIAIKEFTPNGF